MFNDPVACRALRNMQANGFSLTEMLSGPGWDEARLSRFFDLPVWGNSGIATARCKKCIRLQRAGKDAGARTGHNPGRKLRLPGNRDAKTVRAKGKCTTQRGANFGAPSTAALPV
jgi:hypothetical protein